MQFQQIQDPSISGGSAGSTATGGGNAAALDAAIRRRSRHDQDGRDFKCSICERTYLSYPAMYNHMKVKHQQNPNGVPSGMSRGRGRPKREYQNALVNGPSGTLQPSTKPDPTSEAFFNVEGRYGGPTDPNSNFDEVFLNVYDKTDFKYDRKPDKHPLKSLLSKYSHQITPTGNETQNSQNELLQMSEEWRTMVNMDEILAAFLRDVSLRVNEQFYRTMLQFVLLYRECLNEYGWQKRAEADCRQKNNDNKQQNGGGATAANNNGNILDDNIIQEQMMTYKDLIQQHEYTQINNAEVAPEICNEFVTIFMEAKTEGTAAMDRDILIDLVRNLCHWLFVNGHTCSKLSLI